MSGLIELPEPYPLDQPHSDELSADNWRPVLGVIHRPCGQTAYVHPHTNLVWGCVHCVMTTNSDPDIFFAVDPQVLAAVSS